MINTLLGHRVHIQEPGPKMCCSKEFRAIQSPELVAATDAWMLSFFGYADPTIPHGGYLLIYNGDLVMSRSTWDAVRKAVKP